VRLVPVVGPDGAPQQVKAYTAQEAADKLGLHVSTVRRKVQQGLWPHVWWGHVYFTEDQLARIVEAAMHEHSVVTGHDTEKWSQ
jgi:excisionase family DNA binding protein